MKKYITMLVLAAMASTAMAKQTFHPKHPGILAQQIEQKQIKIESKKIVSPILKKGPNKPVSTSPNVDAKDLQLDSVIVTHNDEIKEIKYYEYHPNGKEAKMVVKKLDSDGNWVETEHTEWTEDYPKKGSSIANFGYNDLNEYGILYKKEYLDDYETSYIEYFDISGQLKPFERVSATVSESGNLQSVAYYIYDEQGNEVLEDSIAYTYNEVGLVEREIYFEADKNGQMVELGYYETTYDVDVETPVGPGTKVCISDSEGMFKLESIVSNDENYQYIATYSKENSSEWEKVTDHTKCESIDSTGESKILNIVETDINYKDNAVISGTKNESKGETKISDTWSQLKVELRQYSCTTDTTQWLLLRLLEDVYKTSLSEYGREDGNHQAYVTEADENGELHDDFDVMLFDDSTWIDPYTCEETEYYMDNEEDSSEHVTYYYSDPNSTGITVIEAQAEDGVMYDLNGRIINADLNGFVIRNGKVFIIK